MLVVENNDDVPINVAFVFNNRQTAERAAMELGIIYSVTVGDVAERREEQGTMYVVDIPRRGNISDALRSIIAGHENDVLARYPMPLPGADKDNLKVATFNKLVWQKVFEQLSSDRLSSPGQ